MVTVTWKSGEVDRAPDWDAMLVRLGRKQLDFEVEIRRALAKRCYYWGGVYVDPETASAEDIVRAMMDAGMLVKIDVTP